MKLRCWVECGENVGRFWYNVSKLFEASAKQMIFTPASLRPPQVALFKTSRDSQLQNVTASQLSEWGFCFSEQEVSLLLLFNFCTGSGNTAFLSLFRV